MPSSSSSFPFLVIVVFLHQHFAIEPLVVAKLVLLSPLASTLESLKRGVVRVLAHVRIVTCALLISKFSRRAHFGDSKQTLHGVNVHRVRQEHLSSLLNWLSTHVRLLGRRVPSSRKVILAALFPDVFYARHVETTGHEFRARRARGALDARHGARRLSASRAQRTVPIVVGHARQRRLETTQVPPAQTRVALEHGPIRVRCLSAHHARHVLVFFKVDSLFVDDIRAVADAENLPLEINHLPIFPLRRSVLRRGRFLLPFARL